VSYSSGGEGKGACSLPGDIIVTERSPTHQVGRGVGNVPGDIIVITIVITIERYLTHKVGRGGEVYQQIHISPQSSENFKFITRSINLWNCFQRKII